MTSRDYSLIDPSGNVLAFELVFADSATEGRVAVSRDGKSGYLDLQGNVAIPFLHDSVLSLSDRLGAVEKGEKWSYVDRECRVVISFEFDYAGPFARGLTPVKFGPKSGFIDKSGRIRFYLIFDATSGFLNGAAETDVARFWTENQEFGYVDTSGHMIWEPTRGTPDHPPLFGWSEEDEASSCVGISAEERLKIRGFPTD